jgi:DNA-binding response OmpR family regulator
MTDRLAGKRVLIVEDERIIALNLATEVASRGAKAIWPAGVDAALNAAKSHGPGWCDHRRQLEGLSGFPDRRRSRGPTHPIRLYNGV